jgi:hypothetical protein
MRVRSMFSTGGVQHGWDSQYRADYRIPECQSFGSHGAPCWSTLATTVRRNRLSSTLSGARQNKEEQISYSVRESFDDDGPARGSPGWRDRCCNSAGAVGFMKGDSSPLAASISSARSGLLRGYKPASADRNAIGGSEAPQKVRHRMPWTGFVKGNAASTGSALPAA